MNKEEFIEFHKYLAMLIYEYNLILLNPNLTIPMIRKTRKILSSLKEVQKICLIEKERQWK